MVSQWLFRRHPRVKLEYGEILDLIDYLEKEEERLSENCRTGVGLTAVASHDKLRKELRPLLTKLGELKVDVEHWTMA